MNPNVVDSETPKSEDDALARRTDEVRSALKELFSDLNSPLFSDEYHYDDIAENQAVGYNPDYSKDYNGIEYITVNSISADGEEQQKSQQEGLNTSFMSVFSLDDLKDSLNQSSYDNEMDETNLNLDGDGSNTKSHDHHQDLYLSENVKEQNEHRVHPSAITPSTNFIVTERFLEEGMHSSPYQAQIELESMRSVAEQLTLEAQTYQIELFKLQSNINTLRSDKASLQQAQVMILEEKACVENENKAITSKCVELEKIATDATIECESLSKRLIELETDLFHLSEERDEILLLHEQFEKSMKHKEVTMQRDADELLEESRRMEGKLTKLKLDKAALDNEIEILTKSNQSLKEEINSLKIIIDKLDMDKKAIQGLYDDLTVKCSFLEEALQQKTNEQLEITQDRDQILGVNLELTKRISSLEESSSTFEEECGRLRNMNTLFKTKLEDHERDYGPKLKNIDSMRQQISILTNQLQAARIENVALSDNKSDLDMQLNLYRKEISGLKEKLSSTNDQLSKISQAYETMTKENLCLKDSIECMNDELMMKSALQNELENVTSSRTELDKKVHSLELELKSAKDSLESMHRNPFTPSSATHSFFEPPGSSTSSAVGIQTPAYLTYSSKNIDILEPRSAQSMDDRLERIKLASDRAIRTLQNITNAQTQINREVKEARISKVNETEAFVLDVLNSCCQIKR